MAFQLPAIQASVPVTDPQTGMMTAYFSDWLTRVLNQLTSQINLNTSTIAALQQTQAQLLAAVATIQAVQNALANPGTHTGFATQVLNVGLGWSMGPEVFLSGVSAGNLSISGSGPTQQSNTYSDNGTFIGNWRVQEIVGVSETTVFTGTFTATQTFDGETDTTYYNLYNNSDTTALIARTSTGSVAYRMDLEFTTGVSAFNVVASIYVARS